MRSKATTINLVVAFFIALERAEQVTTNYLLSKLSQNQSALLPLFGVFFADCASQERRINPQGKIDRSMAHNL